MRRPETAQRPAIVLRPLDPIRSLAGARGSASGRTQPTRKKALLGIRDLVPAPAGQASLQDEQLRPEEPIRRFRLVLADDHYAVREELRRLLSSEFEVLTAVADGGALIDAAARLKPDAIVTDVRMPRFNGIQACQLLLDRGVSSAVVALSMYCDPHLVTAALQAGIRAYVLKVDAGDELIPAIHAALRGKRYLSQGVRERYPG